jgi:polysaccharide pyruvyl transferase WcaK-like protein
MGINAITRGLLNGIHKEASDEVQIKLLSFVIKKRRTTEFKSYILDEIPSSVRENIKILLKLLFSYPGSKKNGNEQGSLHSIYREADVILDLSAGDSFTDIYGIKRYLYTSLPKLVAIKMKKDLILLPQTIGPFRHFAARAVSRYIVKHCRMNYARDKVSYDYLLNGLKAAETKSALVPDLAFNMPPSEENLIREIIDENSKSRAPVIGINISALLYSGGYRSKNQFKLKADYKQLVSRMIEYFMKKKCTILLVPHVLNYMEDVEDDYSICQKTAQETSKYYPNVFSFQKRYREDQIKSIIGKCDFFIGSRMHACIGAISMGVPTVPVAYSRKFSGVWDTFGMKDCVADARTMDINEIINKIDLCYSNRAEIKNQLNSRLKNVKEGLDFVFESIMSCLR